MEKDIQKRTHIVKKRNVVLSTFLAASLSAGLTEPLIQGKNPSEETIYSQSDFNPVIIYEDSLKDRSYSNVEIRSTPLSEKTKEQKGFDKVLSIMQDHKDTFNEGKIEDVRMYYPIYKAAAEKYKIDWFLLYIVHKAETGASRGERGFAPDSYYVGAMQRDPNVWSETYVNESADGLEKLSKLPQRHKSDWKEIAAAAHMLSDNFHKYLGDGYSKEKAILKALIRYSAEVHARERFETYKEYNKIFNN